MPPRRRTIPTRRPRVAGLTNRTDVVESEVRATTVTAAPSPPGRPAEDAHPSTRHTRMRPVASPPPVEPEVPAEDVEATVAPADTDRIDTAPDDAAIDDAAVDDAAVDDAAVDDAAVDDAAVDDAAVDDAAVDDAAVDDAAVDPTDVDLTDVDPTDVDPTDVVEPAADDADGETVSLAKPSVADEPDSDHDTGVVTTKQATRKPAAKKRATNAAARPAGRSGRTSSESRPSAPAATTLLDRLRTVPVLAGLLVVLVALAAFFGIATAGLRGTPAAANTALTDVATTAEVGSQIGDALEKLYSYDFARLDENERAAREVITEGFTADFDRLFSQVRELAPQQQAVVSASVTVSAVREIADDRAVLVAFMDQQATTVASEEQVAAQGRLTVTAERGEDGRWRIAGVESR